MSNEQPASEGRNNDPMRDIGASIPSWRALPLSIKLSVLPLTSAALVGNGESLAKFILAAGSFAASDVTIADIKSALLLIHVLISLFVFVLTFERARRRETLISAHGLDAIPGMRGEGVDATGHFINLFTAVLVTINLLEPASERQQPALLVLVLYALLYLLLYPLYALRLDVREVHLSGAAHLYFSGTQKTLTYLVMERLARYLGHAVPTAVAAGLGGLLPYLLINDLAQHYHLFQIPGRPLSPQPFWVLNPSLLFIVSLQVSVAQLALQPRQRTAQSSGGHPSSGLFSLPLPRALLINLAFSMLLNIAYAVVALTTHGHFQCTASHGAESCGRFWIVNAAIGAWFSLSSFAAFLAAARARSGVMAPGRCPLGKRFMSLMLGMLPFLVAGVLVGAGLLLAGWVISNPLPWHVLWMHGAAFGLAGLFLTLLPRSSGVAASSHQLSAETEAH